MNTHDCRDASRDHPATALLQAIKVLERALLLIPPNFPLNAAPPDGSMNGTQENSPMQQHAPPAIASAIDDYLDDLRQTACSDRYIEETRWTLERASKANGWGSTHDIEAAGLRRWFSDLATRNRKPKTRKLYRDALSRWFGWMTKRGILPSNPIGEIPKPIVRAAPARIVPTEADVRALIVAAAKEPRTKDRWLVYLTAATAGLRWSECKRLTWDEVREAATPPHLELSPHTTKTRRQQTALLTPELAAHLAEHRKASRSSRVFEGVPRGGNFNRDLRRAGIHKKSTDGRTFSFHSLRHFFSNRNMRLGFTLEERRIANRHATLRMTADTYTDPTLIPIAERFAATPSLLAIGQRLQPLAGATRVLVPSDREAHPTMRTTPTTEPAPLDRRPEQSDRLATGHTAGGRMSRVHTTSVADGATGPDQWAQQDSNQMRRFDPSSDPDQDTLQLIVQAHRDLCACTRATMERTLATGAAEATPHAADHDETPPPRKARLDRLPRRSDGGR